MAKIPAKTIFSAVTPSPTPHTYICLYTHTKTRVIIAPLFLPWTAHSCSPSVLVPGLDLCVGQVESRCQVHAVLHAEVFLPLEAPLQLVELVVREGRPGFARFFRAHRRTVSAAGDLPVTFFFGAWVETVEEELMFKKNHAKNYNYLCTLCIQFFDCVSDCAKLSPTTPFERERARTGIGRAEFVTKVFLFPSENETSVNQSVSICSRFQSTVIPPPGRTIISLIDPPGRPHARGESPGLHLFSHPLHKYSVLKQRT